jgi:hypothetical protein
VLLGKENDLCEHSNLMFNELVIIRLFAGCGALLGYGRAFVEQEKRLWGWKA